LIFVLTELKCDTDVSSVRAPAARSGAPQGRS
jgi:hypothetical protein